MDTDSILTFRAPAPPAGRVDATISPVLELVYAAFMVQRRGRDAGASASATSPAWLNRLAREAPDVLEAVTSAIRRDDAGKAAPNIEVVLLAARYGYVHDADPERFLADFAGLTGRALAERGAFGEEDEAMATALRARLQVLAEGPAAEAWTAAHRRLWRALRSTWEHEARPAAEAAVASFWQGFEAAGHVLPALPQHHFVRFEGGATMIERAEREGRVVVVPLGLAAGGGLLFEVDATVYVGYGLRTEQLHEHLSERLTDLARRMRAFADPTRAGLLGLIGRFGNLSGLHLTVGDLADQVGVSQPTVSGHLRVLREAGLVQLDKRGNKAYYVVDEEALRGLLRAFEEAVLDAPRAPDEAASSA